jgi:hypothetical protein
MFKLLNEGVWQELVHNKYLHFKPSKENKFCGKYLSHSLLHITFRRSLSENKWWLWLELVLRVMHIQRINERDVFVCGLTAPRGFTVKSMYL